MYKIKDKKFNDLVRRISIAKRKGQIVPEADYFELVDLVKRLDVGPTQTIVEFIVDVINEESKIEPSRISNTQTIAEYVDSGNKKKKYSPKIREASIPIRYFGSEWSMKELTKKIEHPLHYVFISEAGTNVLCAFDNYKPVEVALEREKLIEEINYGINRMIKSTSVRSQISSASTIMELPNGQHVIGDNGTDPPPEYCLGYPATRPKRNAQFFEHINYEGEILELEPGFWYPDLRDKWRHWFLFFMTDDWNDSISSIKTGDGVVVVFEHILGTGASLTLRGSVPTAVLGSAKTNLGNPCSYIEKWLQPRSRYLPRLDLAGWNDRISSVCHYF
jgi:hypothetical protein